MCFADKMIAMGYLRKEIEDALADSSYNDVMATYLLLAKETAQVNWDWTATI